MALWYSRNIQNQQDVAINGLASYVVEYDGEAPDVETDNNVVVPECPIVLSYEQWAEINRIVLQGFRDSPTNFVVHSISCF